VRLHRKKDTTTTVAHAAAMTSTDHQPGGTITPAPAQDTVDDGAAPDD
jgi:hypothetical protein